MKPKKGKLKPKKIEVYKESYKNKYNKYKNVPIMKTISYKDKVNKVQKAAEEVVAIFLKEEKVLDGIIEH